MRTVVVFMVVLAWANTLFTYLPDIPVYPPRISIATATVADTTRELTDAAPVQPAPPVDIRDSPRDKLESPEPSVLTSVALATDKDVVVKEAAPAPSVVAPTATGNVAETIVSNESAASPPLNDAKFYCERGIVFYRKGDLPAALADFDLAIRLDPDSESAYIDRGITLYRMREFDRAFADVAQAVRIKNSHQTATPPLPRLSPLSSKN